MDHPDPHITPELERSALVVIDTQVDFVDGGVMPIAGTSEVLPVIAGLLTAYRAAGLPIVHVVRLYTGDDVDLCRRELIASGAPIARPGSAGSQIAPELLPEGAPVLGLGVTTVVIAGCNYPNCPRAAVYGASERDYRVLLVADAISGVEQHHLIEAARMGVLHATGEEIVRGMAEPCLGTPRRPWLLAC